MKIAVIGAGIVGLSTAYELARAGHQAVILEKGYGVGLATSFANGAQLSYAYVQPLATPNTLRDVPGYLLDPEAPLKFNLQLSLHQWKWCYQFLLACNHKQVERATQQLLKLSASSRAGFEAWREATQPDCDFAENGKLVIYPHQAAVNGAAKQVALQAPMSPLQQICSTEECIALEPALENYRARFAGGVWTESECVVDAYKTCCALENDIIKLGGQFLFNTEVKKLVQQAGKITKIITNQGELDADAIVVANAHAALDLLRPLKIDVPLYPLKGYSITLPKSVLKHAPIRSITDAKRKIVFAPIGNAIRVAGMAELMGENLEIKQKRINELIACTDLLFGLHKVPADVHAWAGLRPVTPTSLPVIGKTKYKNLFLNLGQGALGLTLAFGSAKMIVEEIHKN